MHRYVIDLALDIARIVVLLILYLAQRKSNRGNEMCDNEMSRDHDAPLEYLRILASLKLRFGLATLVTAHGALPVCSPMVALDTQLPNGCVGHSASQWLRGSSSFPINVTARPAAIPVVHNTHPLQAAFQLHMICWATSNNRDRFHRPGFTGNACQVVPIQHSRRQERIHSDRYSTIKVQSSQGPGRRPSLPPSGTSRCASIFVTKVPGLFKVATTSQGASAQHSSDIRGQVGPTGWQWSSRPRLRGAHPLTDRRSYC